MIFTPTPLAGALIITPEKIVDERGFFARIFCRREFEARGLNPNLVQCNISFNKKKGTLRGMHYQLAPHEAGQLRLDCSKARAKLKWIPAWTGSSAIEKTTLWYKAFYESSEILSLEQLKHYVAEAKSKHIAWVEE